MRIKEMLNTIYLDWVNNYLTLDCMALNEGIRLDDLKILIDLGRKINHREYKEEVTTISKKE